MQGASKLGVEATQEVTEQIDRETVEPAAKKKIVIGENMKRVQKYADEIGADIFKGTGIEENRKWIREQMKEGAEIYDIGPDFTRRLERRTKNVKPDSPYYGMERMETKNYPTNKLFERKGKYEGGVPDFE